MSSDNKTPQTLTDKPLDDTQDVEWEEVDEAIDGEYSRDGNIDQQAANALPLSYKARARFGIIVLLVTFVGFGGWAALAPLDGAAVAPGSVIVESQNRVVQHLEGGIVANIHVRDGDRVEEGGPLITLSETVARADLDIVTAELYEALGQESRLMAERSGADDITFDPMLLEASDDPRVINIINGQRELFDARRQSYQGRLTIYEQRIDALRQQMRGLRGMARTLESRTASYDAELEHWRELFEEGLADRLRINEMERELFRLQGDKDNAEAQLAELEVRIGETRSELLVARESYAEDIASELRRVQQSKAELLGRKITITDSLTRRQLVSPVTGTIVGMKVHTVGSVVQPGDTLMEIVPEDQSYTIRARVQTQDIDRVSVGQIADLQLSAFNLQLAHVIEGELTKLSADALKDEQSGEHYYEAIVVVTEKGMEQMVRQGMYLVPGMPAEVMIKTGERTLFQYLMEPFFRMFRRSFREE